ncbi:MAG: hypothetical protein CL472_08510 [Acidobacteria bacterium]|nr:hypothetical protein [Acidobacteriota bacterium]
MTASLAFDPPNPSGVEDAVHGLKTVLEPHETAEPSPSVNDILAAEGARRAGESAEAIRAEPAPWDAFKSARRRADERLALNAFIRLFSEDEARSMSGVKATGDGTLANLPFAFKDVFFAHGHLPGDGTPYRFRPREGEQAPLLERLFVAGAIPVGATNLDPFSYSTTGENPFYGAPVNPRDPELLVGGSSSGSSVAVGAGIVPFAIGTDTGGSIRIPAAFCGVWGWKPTNGLLDASGLVPLSPSHDCPAVVANDARMLRRVAETLIEKSSPTWRAAENSMRIGIARELFAASDADTAKALNRFLAAAGARPGLDITVPDLGLCNGIATVVTGYEAARFLHPAFEEMPDAFTANVRQRLAIGASIERRVYDVAQRIRSRLTLEFLAGALSKCDLIVSPITPRACYRREELNGPAGSVRALTLELLQFNRWVNSLGLPAVAIPFRLCESGQMVAVQIIGRPYGDLDLLRFAEGLAL